MMIVGVNNFVRRQVKGSGKTYSETVGFESIAAHALSQMEKGNFSEGYRDGVRIVHAEKSFAIKFACPFIKLDKHSKLTSKLVQRRVDEDLYIQTRVLNGVPSKTVALDLILYRHDVLMENNENSTNDDWELISIHAIPKGIKKIPMGPVTMMRNQLEKPGGTKANFTSKEWADSIQFWQEFAVLEIEKE
jgi:hypothetical protein